MRISRETELILPYRSLNIDCRFESIWGHDNCAEGDTPHAQRADWLSVIPQVPAAISVYVQDLM
jgi:hypothetical protein